jgi:hypothetical protein
MSNTSPRLKVALLLPATGGFKEETTLSIAQMCMYSVMRGIDVSNIHLRMQAGIAASRNALVAEALEDTSYTHVLFIDHDISFPADALERLLAYDLDIVGASYTLKGYPYQIVGCPDKDTPPDERGVQPFLALPGGFMLVKMGVYRDVPAPWYVESYLYTGSAFDQFFAAVSGALCCVNIPCEVKAELSKCATLGAWLDEGTADGERWSRGGKEKGLTADSGEDTNFNRKARNFGYKTYCDLNLTTEIIHYGAKGFYVGCIEYNEAAKGGING